LATVQRVSKWNDARRCTNEVDDHADDQGGNAMIVAGIARRSQEAPQLPRALQCYVATGNDG
jgi:hypothetical protein